MGDTYRRRVRRMTPIELATESKRLQHLPAELRRQWSSDRFEGRAILQDAAWRNRHDSDDGVMPRRKRN